MHTRYFCRFDVGGISLERGGGVPAAEPVTRLRGSFLAFFACRSGLGLPRPPRVFIISKIFAVPAGVVKSYRRPVQCGADLVGLTRVRCGRSCRVHVDRTVTHHTGVCCCLAYE